MPSAHETILYRRTVAQYVQNPHLVSHVRQTLPAEGAEGHKGMPSSRGPLRLELQALVNSVEASLDDSKRAS